MSSPSRDGSFPHVGRRVVLRAGRVGALAGALLVAGTSSADATPGPPEPALTGVWRSTFTRTQPAPNPVLNRRTLTCLADATVLLGGSPVLPEAGRLLYRDLGAGQWRCTGEGRFAVGLVINAYAEDGAYRYETVLTMDLTLDPGLDTLTGTYDSQDVELDGAVRGRRGGTITATRVRLPA